MVLPYKVVSEGLRSIQAALSASSPIKGFVVAISHLDDHIGCLAVVQQIGRIAGIVNHVILKGCQRVIVHRIERGLNTEWHSSRWAQVTILKPEWVSRTPREVLEGNSWGQWAVKMMDPYALAKTAFKAASTIVKEVADLRDDPVACSYWLANALPIDQEHRRALLAENCVVYRLRKELELMMDMTGIYCRTCQTRLGNASDVLTLSESGPCEVFINNHGFLHELMTLRSVQGVRLDGHPVQEHSWFPGYAWTLMHCDHCFVHVGWRFTAINDGLRPRCFWGFSRRQLIFQRQSQ